MNINEVQSSSLRWENYVNTHVLYDKDYKVGQVKQVFGGGYLVGPFWNNDALIFDGEEEEAKAYLIAIYRLR